MNYNETKKRIEICSQKNIDEIPDEDFSLIDDIKIDLSKSIEERVLAYLSNTVNPYALKTRDIKILIKFRNNGIKFNECLLKIINARV